ncbi:hypothetical protein [Protofrankia sp. BMG5.30]|uniref:hypothetical protein n=1 Tax=Protofrankia sp. BMG5.30 TaxID=1834514 RepID=UPI00097685E7|nr:hypothetical protein [Protofrankia sp. BMG5.30]ONH34708.1 hypothetical protein BL254_14880 [Protofrankia sp. BMG5.30]
MSPILVFFLFLISLLSVGCVFLLLLLRLAEERRDVMDARRLADSIHYPWNPHNHVSRYPEGAGQRIERVE